jgi:anaerobic selenocysteine-containing dehydrogenase
MATIRVVCGHDCPDLCSLLAQVENGQVVQVRGDPDHPFTAGFACGKTNRDAELVNSPERLATPLRRTGPKGSGEFAPIGWDEALDEITARFGSIIAESSALAILGYAYSAHTGVMNRGLLNGVFHALGTSRLDAGTVCDSCAIEAWNATVGPVGGTDPEAVVDSDLLVSWGCDLVTTNVHFWAKIVHERKRGLKVVVIDPRRSRTAQSADWHLSIRIGTDAALALGIMHILVRDGSCDRKYIAAHTIGFERLEREVLPRFAPPRVASITGLSVLEIERFAALYGGARSSFIRLGEGMTRLAQGGQALRAVASLPGVTGAYARRGGGSLLYTGDFGGFDSDAVGKPSGPSATRTVNHLRLGEALLELADPPIRGLFIASNNPAVTCPDVGKVRRGLAREDLFTVVHDPFMSVTARYADVVLPAAVYLETEDLYRAYGAYYLQYAPRAAAPRGLAWSNFRLAQALARRMGLTDSVFQKSEAAIMRELFRGVSGDLRDGLHGAAASLARDSGSAAASHAPDSRPAAASHAPDSVSAAALHAPDSGPAAASHAPDSGSAATFDPDALRAAGPIKITPADAQVFATPSGKLEFFSQSLADRHLAPMPDWHPDPEEEEQAARWPLRLLTAPGYFQPHTTYSGVQSLRRQEGAPVCILHPAEATSRNLRDGQPVRVFNDRATIGLVLRVSDEVQAGVAFVPGQRRDDETLSGTVNMLCSDRYTDLGDGATYQSTWLEVAAWDAEDSARVRDAQPQPA